MSGFDQIFSDFGGVSVISAILEIPDSHARTMKARGSIPIEYWDRLIKAASERSIQGVTWESLQAARRATRKVRASTSEVA
ncbi:hypothetical protein [Xanthobacter flavus]|uniref:hypothetical protein n=1 Tax=Xanthobacter flavus TaxID=281 RepID=UPI001AE120DB|nr:hypothetical protein [Xanthobacter flavus]MBP2147425.1 hypothetical protein [Xanthobacter flavus]